MPSSPAGQKLMAANPVDAFNAYRRKGGVIQTYTDWIQAYFIDGPDGLKMKPD